MQISYDYYRIFYYVAKHKSFTQAAEALYNNQPNISRSVKNLETALECELFTRGKRGIELTPEGEKLYERVSVAFEQIQAGEAEIALDKNLHNGIVSIGVSETTLHGYMLPILREYHKRYADIKLRIANYNTPQAVKALKNGLIDFAVLTSPIEPDENLDVFDLIDFKDVLICGQDFAYLTNKSIDLSELGKLPVVMLDRHTATYKLYTELFIKHGLTLRPDIEVATTEQILSVVKNNLGVGFLPEIVTEESIANGTILPLKINTELPLRHICFVKRTRTTLNIAAKKLEAIIKNNRL